MRRDGTLSRRAWKSNEDKPRKPRSFRARALVGSVLNRLGSRRRGGGLGSISCYRARGDTVLTSDVEDFDRLLDVFPFVRVEPV
jgi:hypothetical protein